MVKMPNKHFGVIFDLVLESYPTQSHLVINAKTKCLEVPGLKIKTNSF